MTSGLRLVEHRAPWQLARVVRFMRTGLASAAAYSPQERAENSRELTLLGTLRDVMAGYRRVLVAERGGEIVAAAFVWYEEDVSYSGWVVVREDLRGQGLLRELSHDFLTWLSENRVLVLRSECRVANEASARLMRAVGFDQLGGISPSYGGAPCYMFVLDVNKAISRKNDEWRAARMRAEGGGA